jgi:hypothetical protein
MKLKNSNLWAWAREARASWRAVGMGATAAVAVTERKALTRLAAETARKFARTFEASGGRALDASEREELANVAARVFLRAWRSAGAVPAAVALTLRDGSQVESARAGVWTVGSADGGRVRAWFGREGGGVAWSSVASAADFARAVWQRAEGRARRRMRSSLYARGWERVGVQSIEAAREAGREWEREGWGAFTPRGMLGGRARGGATAGARPVEGMADADAAARVCLAVYWGKEGGQRWQSALVDSLRLLDAAREAAARRGLASLDALGLGVDERGRGIGDGATAGKLRVAVHRLTARIHAGRAVIAREPLRAAAVVEYVAAVMGLHGVSGAVLDRVHASAAGLAMPATVAADIGDNAGDAVAVALLADIRRATDRARRHPIARQCVRLGVVAWACSLGAFALGAWVAVLALGAGVWRSVERVTSAAARAGALSFIGGRRVAWREARGMTTARGFHRAPLGSVAGWAREAVAMADAAGLGGLVALVDAGRLSPRLAVRAARRWAARLARSPRAVSSVARVCAMRRNEAAAARVERATPARRTVALPSLALWLARLGMARHAALFVVADATARGMARPGRAARVDDGGAARWARINASSARC